MSEGSLGAEAFCDPSRVFTGDGEPCDTGGNTRMGLSFRLYPLVISLPPLPDTPVFFVAMQHAEATQNCSTGSAAYRRILALSQTVEAAATSALAAGLLTSSEGCVNHPHEQIGGTRADARHKSARGGGTASWTRAGHQRASGRSDQHRQRG